VLHTLSGQGFREVDVPVQGSREKRGLGRAAEETLAVVRAGSAVGDAPSAQAIGRALSDALASPDLDASPRCRTLLRFMVAESLASRGKGLNPMVIALAVFGRGADHDAAADPIVRLQAGRLRRSLERYYHRSGSLDAVRIELPRGAYAPLFRNRTGRTDGDGPAS
jgi:hypothetical protein